MVTAMAAAHKAARKAIEGTYSGEVTVTEHQKVKDEISKVTGYKDVIVLTSQPCRLSFERLRTAVQGDSSASVAQTTKLFISPDITVKPGSKLTIKQGVTKDYTCSGIPAVYETHQEILLELFERWT